MIDNTLITEIVLTGGKWLHIEPVEKPFTPGTYWQMLFIFDVYDPERVAMETLLADERDELADMYDWRYGPGSDATYSLPDTDAQ